MKSTGPILMFLSNSGEFRRVNIRQSSWWKRPSYPWQSPCQRRYWQQRCLRPMRCKTHPKDENIIKIPTLISYLWLWDEQVVRVLSPHWTWQWRYVGWVWVAWCGVGLLHLWNRQNVPNICFHPCYLFHPVSWQSPSIQHAEGAQFEVTRVAGPKLEWIDISSNEHLLVLGGCLRLVSMKRWFDEIGQIG